MSCHVHGIPPPGMLIYKRILQPTVFDSISCKLDARNLRGKQAEGEGFEPPDPCGSPVFKTGGFNRSPTPPDLLTY